VKQYLDTMIAHCEQLAGKVEPGIPPLSIGDHREIRGLYDWAEVVEIDEQDLLIIGR
jgi:hypothetical protein